MMNKKEITAFQLIFLLIHVQVGVGLINLPYDIFLQAKSDAWISILLAGIFIQLIILGYGILIKRFPNHHIYEIHLIVFGKWFGSFIIILVILYFIMSGSIVLANFVYLIRNWMMPLTPRWVFISLMCFTAIFIVTKNIQVIARFIVLSSALFIGFIAAIVYSFKFANMTFILPVGASGIPAITKGILPSFLSFHGFGMLLIFYPFVKASNRTIIKSASIANLFVTIFYTLLVLVSLLFFSPEELKMIPEPVLYLIKAFSFRIIERPDLLFTSMWIVFVATSFIIYIYSASLGIMTITNHIKLSHAVMMMIPICFIISANIKGVYNTEFVTTFFNTYLIPIFVFLPFLLLLVSFIRRKKGVDYP